VVAVALKKKPADQIGLAIRPACGA